MGKERIRRMLSAKAIGGRTSCQSEGGSPRSTVSGACQSKVFVTMSPSTAVFPGVSGFLL